MRRLCRKCSAASAAAVAMLDAGAVRLLPRFRMAAVVLVSFGYVKSIPFQLRTRPCDFGCGIGRCTALVRFWCNNIVTNSGRQHAVSVAMLTIPKSRHGKSLAECVCGSTYHRKAEMRTAKTPIQDCCLSLTYEMRPWTMGFGNSAVTFVSICNQRSPQLAFCVTTARRNILLASEPCISAGSQRFFEMQ